MLCSDIYPEILSFVDNKTLYDTLTVSKGTQLYKELNEFRSLNLKVTFKSAVQIGSLFIAKWLYLLQEIDTCESFEFICNEKHTEVLKWLRSLNNIRIEVAKWLYLVSNINIDMTTFVPKYDHLDVTRWLYSVDNMNIHL